MKQTTLAIVLTLFTCMPALRADDEGGSKFLPANNSGSKVYLPAGIAAVVEDRLILDSQLQGKLSQAVESLLTQFRKDPATFQRKLTEARNKILEDLIADELILIEAERAGAKVSVTHLDSAVQDYIKTRFSGDSNQFMKAFTGAGLSMDEFRERLRRRDLVAAARQERIEKLPAATTEQIERYYHDHQNDFRIKDSVKLGVIVLNRKPGDDQAQVEAQRNLAAEIRAKLTEGQDFATVAKVYSQGRLADQGGDWGWVERNILRAELDAAAFALKAGETSEVIETLQGWYILRVSERRPSALKPLAEVKEEIRKTLKQQATTSALIQWNAQLRAKAFIRYLGGSAYRSFSSPAKVAKIEIQYVGPATVTDEQIRSLIRAKVDGSVTQLDVDDDIRSLFATGAFSNIRVQATDASGGITLNYVLQEQPVVNEIRLNGNKALNSDKLLPVLASKTGQRLDERKLFDDTQAIRNLYQKEGFPQPDIKYLLKIHEASGHASASFEITERP